MNRIPRRTAAVLSTLLVLALTACGGLPTSGPVNAGAPIVDADANSDLVFLPDGPSPDATAQQIVEGFIAAGSGPRDNWQIAKEFLAPGATWNPRAGVTVYSPGQRTLQESAEGEFTLTVTPVATVDADGELSAPGTAGDISLPFTLARQADGQWRITKVSDGVVLDRNRFSAVYGSYALQFFDPTWTYLVPDERWFPRLYASTSVAEALVDGGPSAWLAGSVATAFADGARLAQAAVPVRSGVAAVSLQPGARALEQQVRNRMQTQLEASLTTVAGIGAVDMLVDEQPLGAEPVPVRRTTIDARPLVRTAEAFGFISGDSVEQIAGLSDALLQVDATDIEIDGDRAKAAVRDAAGAVLAVAADGTLARLDGRPGLVAPSIDPFGYVWSVPQGSPSAVAVFSETGAGTAVAGAWPGAAEVLAQRVSRDGTRVAAVVREGQAYALWVAGIQRDRTGLPTSLGERKVLAPLTGAATALTWLDAVTLAVVAVDGRDLQLSAQEIGGFATVQRAPDAVTAAAGTASTGGVRLRDAAGELFGQRGANWQDLASGILVLAVQQGTPR